MKEMCNITHNSYDRISDKVMYLGSCLYLNFVVDLYFQRKDINKNNVKNNYHKEVMYKADNGDYRIKIVREFYYYFSIEMNVNNIKDSARVGIENLYPLIFNLNKVIEWFTGKNGTNTVFSTKNGKLFIPSHPDSIRVQLAFNTSIEFEAAIGNVNGYDTIGVLVYINNNSYPVFVSHSTIFALYQMLSTCNMYMMAQNMLNYVRPNELGINIYDMSSMESKMSNRKNNMSFFDRIGAKENKE